MRNKNLYTLLVYFTALVWFINGLYCKVLNQVPRHHQIVSKICGSSFSKELTIIIGFSEIIMTFWILSNYKRKFNAITQITIVLLMNSIEFILAPELLLWGKLNFLFAFFFSAIIYLNEFHLKPKENV